MGDGDSRVLLTVPTRPHRSGAVDQEDETFKTAVVGRRLLHRISLQDGIVGKCVRKMQIIHVEQLIMSADVSERADGVDMSSYSTDINMLARPMVANLSEKVLLIGTLQIIEKKRDDADTSAARSSRTQTGARQSNASRE